MGVTSTIVRNDIKREFRDPISFASAVLIGIGTVISLRIALAGTSTPDPLVAAGGLWIALLFGNLLVVGKPIAQEHQSGTMEALCAAPISRVSIVMGKAVGAACIGAVTQLVITLVFVIGFPTKASPLEYLLMFSGVLLSAVGFSTAGTLIGVLSLRARGSAPLAAGLLLPLALPVVVVGVLTSLPAFGANANNSVQALAFMAGYAATIITLCTGLAEDLLVE